MNILKRMLIAAAALGLLVSQVHAGEYNASSGITSIAVTSNGDMYIRWAGLPDKVCSGNVSNNGWVVIPAASGDALKSLAMSLYFSAKPAVVVTSGCTAAYENVSVIYSPAG